MPTSIENQRCFEDKLGKFLHFSAEHPTIDASLISLLNLIDRSKQLNDPSGLIFLLTPNVEKKLKKSMTPSARPELNAAIARNDLRKVFLLMRKQEVRPDVITGEFPTMLRYGRKTLHALKLSHAVYITMLQFRLKNVKFLQRCRKGHFVHRAGALMANLFFHYLQELRSKSELEIVKMIKTSLAREVSSSWKQDELPLGEFFDVWPKTLGAHKNHLKRKGEYERFCFAALQSKILCQEVPEEFIQAALEEHHGKLSERQAILEPEFLEKLVERGREFGLLVKKHYDPRRGHQPTRKATYHFSREKGGVHGDLVYHDRLHMTSSSDENPDDRIEPMVIGLFGQPGMGKSTLLPYLINSLSKLFPHCTLSNLVYQRNCNVKHWDGYKGQPIVVLDDIGQSGTGEDIQEFQTLVSCNPYVLPMAALQDKGRKFVSPIIIATSNLRYGAKLQATYKKIVIIDDASFWRRFTVPLYVENNTVHQLKEEPCWIREENLLSSTRLEGNSQTFRDDRYFSAQIHFNKKVREGPRNKWSQDTWEPIPKRTLPKVLVKIFKDRRDFHDNLRNTWRQVVSAKSRSTDVIQPLLEELEPHGFTQSVGSQLGDGSDIFLEFPAYPPEGPLPVRVEPIREPLKVRTITAGRGDTFCLKPFARAMWRALGEEEQFVLTHGTNNLDTAIKRMYKNGQEDDVWISGDYSAATDSFPIEATKALMTGILESIDHLPTKRWALKEISPHLLRYPESSGLKPVLQKSGQLMGSLMSFPLLCLLNDCTARFSGLDPGSYVINGDDILMRTQRHVYPIWKKQASHVGLKLSLGKNYIHPRFGSVNSQFVDGDQIRCAGKQKVLDRRSHILGECLRDWQLFNDEEDEQFNLELFKQLNRSKLQRTVRSIDVPYSHGGLAFSWGRELSPRSQISAKACYLYDLFSKIKPEARHVALPYLSNKPDEISDIADQIESFQEPVQQEEFFEDFLTAPKLTEVKKRSKRNEHLRGLFSKDLRTMPSLSFLHTAQIPIKDKELRTQLQQRIDQVFLSRFLRGNGTVKGFSYQDYRDEVLYTSMNIATPSVTNYIVSFMDLDLKPEYLAEIDVSLTDSVSRFDKDSFIEKLGDVDFTPIKFEEMTIPDDFEDFSLELEGHATNDVDEPLLQDLLSDVDETTIQSNSNPFPITNSSTPLQLNEEGESQVFEMNLSPDMEQICADFRAGRVQMSDVANLLTDSPELVKELICLVG